MQRTNTLRNLLEAISGAAGSARTLPARAVLFRTGAPVRSLYLVEAGEIRLVRHPRIGQALVLQVARPGELVAEASLFSSRYHCDAVAASAVRVLRFEVAAVRRGLERHPAHTVELAAHLAREIHHLRARAALLSIRSAQERVLAYLDSLTELDDGCVDPGHPWTTVATEIGLSREALYRALAELERAGRISRQGRVVKRLG